MRLLFPGSFDPFTLGHADIVARGLQLCDELLIAVGDNEHKPGWIPVQERVNAMQQLYASEPRISVCSYSGLTVDFALQTGVTAILRSVRNIKDFEYELDVAQVNRQLTGIETILLLADPSLSSLSSSIVRELFHFGRDITDFLPQGLHYRTIEH